MTFTVAQNIYNPIFTTRWPFIGNSSLRRPGVTRLSVPRSSTWPIMTAAFGPWIFICGPYSKACRSTAKTVSHWNNDPLAVHRTSGLDIRFQIDFLNTTPLLTTNLFSLLELRKKFPLPCTAPHAFFFSLKFCLRKALPAVPDELRTLMQYSSIRNKIYTKKKKADWSYERNQLTLSRNFLFSNLPWCVLHTQIMSAKWHLLISELGICCVSPDAAPPPVLGALHCSS